MWIASGSVEVATFLDRLATHPSLRRLSLNLSTDNPAAFINAIAGIKHLEELTLEFENGALVTDEMIAPLAGLSALRSLMLKRVPAITGKGLAAFSQHRALRELRIIWDSAVDDAGAAEISTIRTLNKLRITSASLTDAGLKSLSALPLASLDLGGCCAISAAGFSALREFKSLTKLDVAGTELDDVGMIAIADLPRLTELDVSATDITSTGAARLARHQMLRRLSCACCAKLGDKGVAAWSTLALISLDLSETGITDAAAKALATMHGLVELNLSLTRISNDAVRAIAGLPRLNLLRANNCYLLTTECTKALVAAPALRYVSVREIPQLDANKFDQQLHKAGVGTFSDATELINERVRGADEEDPPLPPLPEPADRDDSGRT